MDVCDILWLYVTFWERHKATYIVLCPPEYNPELASEEKAKLKNIL